MANALGDTKCPIVQDCDSDKHICVMSELEPYANQDAKIDFSIAGQWVRVGNTIVQTSGTHDKGHIYVYFLGDGLNEAKKVSKLFKWQLLTAAQMKPLLDAYSAITESQSD